MTSYVMTIKGLQQNEKVPFIDSGTRSTRIPDLALLAFGLQENQTSSAGHHSAHVVTWSKHNGRTQGWV